MTKSIYPLLNDYEWLRKRREEHATLVEMAKEAGCHPMAVKRALKRVGLPYERPRPAHKRIPQLEDRAWLERELQTKRIRQIAAELGCGPTPVQNAAKRLNIVIPYRPPAPITPEHRQVMQAAWDERYPNGRRGPDAANWRGGRRISNGYVFLYAPDHPRANQRGVVQEHILVMEQHLGRHLMPGEIVHHKNHVKDDNRLKNLYLTKIGTHVAEHFAEGKRAAAAEAEAERLRAENETLREAMVQLDRRVVQLEVSHG